MVAEMDTGGGKSVGMKAGSDEKPRAGNAALRARDVTLDEGSGA